MYQLLAALAPGIGSKRLTTEIGREVSLMVAGEIPKITPNPPKGVSGVILFCVREAFKPVYC